jgi:hypothetical protein
VSDKGVTAIQPKLVRYIKLGDAGRWERECIDNGIIRFGFGTNDDTKFDVCVRGAWDELTRLFLAEGKNQGTATRFTNESQKFFEDDGSTLWFTFKGEDLWWGFLTDDAPVKHADGHGIWRRVKNGWRNTDANGEPLTKSRLSGALTMIAGYRGTSCSVHAQENYLVRRINGQKTPQVERAVAARKEMVDVSVGLMQLLGPRDFELLVDLVFTSSGWRRVGAVGKTQKTLDLDLILPSTGEKAFVQVKSTTNSKQLASYIEKLDDFDSYSRMFYVFHTGNVADPGDDRVSILGPAELAELVVESGLVGWLIQKTS